MVDQQEKDKLLNRLFHHHHDHAVKNEVTPNQKQHELEKDQLLSRLFPHHHQHEEEENEDDEPNFIKKDEEQQEEEIEKLACDLSKLESQEIINDLRKSILPLSNQQRNLDRETGGLEENRAEGEYTSDDIWDNRSEEVDKMGSTDTFNTTGIRSFVWRKKKQMLDAKKLLKEIAKDAGVSAAVKGKVSEAAGSTNKQEGYVSRLRKLKQDRSHENQNNQGGGISF
jgi:hypothetical protein